MQDWYVIFGVEKVSYLERCPQFRGVLIVPLCTLGLAVSALCAVRTCLL